MYKNKYVKIFLFLSLFAINSILMAQTNLVKNFDFSKKSACPTSMSQLSFLSDWQIGAGTADYFDLCGTGYGGAPNHPWGYQWPHSDSGFVNFGYGESFKQTLSSTIKAGQSVYYEYWTVRGENGQYAMYKFGIQFKFNGQVIHKEVYNDTLIESTNWVPITGCFIAPSDINEIEIGYISGTTGKILYDATKTFSQAYGYVDDVYVIPGYTMSLGNDTSICMEDVLTLDAKVLGATFLWNTAETTQTIGVSGTGNSVYNNDYSVEVSLGMCTWKDTINVAYKLAPTVNLGNDQVICSGQLATLDAGNTGLSYLWSNGKTTQTISVSTASMYSVTVSDGICAGSDTVIVSSVVPPSVSLGNDTSLCDGQNITLDAANSGLSYSWCTGASSQTIALADNSSWPSGIYWVNVSNGVCTSSDTISVQFISNPGVNLGNDQAICSGQSVTLDAANNGATYLWSTSAKTQTITVNSSGTYAVEVTKNGCMGSDTVTITVNPSPIVNLGADTGLCKGGSIVLDAGNAGATYTWSDGSNKQTLIVKDTMFVSGGYFSVKASMGSCIDEDTIMVVFYTKPNVGMADTVFCQYTSVTLDASYAGASGYKWSTGDTTATIDISNQGQYSVIINNNGCQGYDTVSTYMIPVAKLNLGEDTILCDGNTLKLDVGNAGTTYNWSTGETTSSIVVSAAGEYSIMVQNSYCYSYDTINVTYQSYPTVGLGGDFKLCDGATTSISTAYSGALYSWSTGESTQSITIDETGDYWLIVDINHCRDTDSITVTVNPLPVFELGENQSICPNEVLTLVPEVNADVLIWAPSQINGSSAIITEPGTYVVTAIDSNGCEYTDSLTYDDYCPTVVYVPSSFTPNSDGKNDVFLPKGNNVYSFAMTIYDRWGNAIFYSNDLNKGWDGTTNGKLSPDDVYSYKIYYKGERENNIGLEKEMRGSVALFR